MSCVEWDALYPIVLSDEHRERADELGEAGV